ncbi:MAG: GldG family protein [Oscillospiraceae bacterium]|nr:GldG family protein [Oscillospiraceae bacterium]
MAENQKPVKAPAKKPAAKQQKKNQKSFRSASFALILAALVLAIAIPLNLLASRLNIVWDMTPSNMYELTDTTKEYLRNLDKTVDFYFLMDMDVLSTDTESMALYRSLREYEACDKINFIDFEPDSDPDLVKKLQEDGGFKLSSGDMVVCCEERYKRIPANTMYKDSYTTNDDGQRIRDAAFFSGENYITGAIDSVVTGRDTVIYFITGHGEKTIAADYTKLQENLNNRNYAAEPLDLSMNESVPDNAAILIFAAPQKDITNDELRKLNAYLDQGGNICFWMSPNEEKIRYKNIESMLESFGLAMDYDIVAETDKSLHIDGDPYTFRCNVVRSEDEVDLTSEIADAVDAGIVPFMSNTRSFYQLLGSSGTADNTVTSGSLLQTVSTSYDALGNPIATAVGEICGGDSPSAQNIEGQVLDLAMYAESVRRNNAKIMVMGNAEFIDDTNVQQDYMIIPVNLTLSVFSWMYDSDLDMDMGIEDKERGLDSLRLNSEQEANTTNILFVVVPFCMALVGAGVWLKRRYS